jgi:uncharacterized pyridoxamine 5'-phosphate oxidase family protein
MNLTECVQFATEHPVAYLASVDGDQARVRALLMDHADDTGFYFTVLSGKEVTAQLHKNPNVEVCWYNNPAELADCKQMRVTGKVEFLDDPAAKAKAYESRAFLEDVTGRKIKDRVEPLKIAHGEAHFWVLTDAGGEQDLTRLTF